MSKLNFEDFISKIENNIEREYQTEMVDRKLSYINNTANYVINGEWTVEYEELPISMKHVDIAGFSTSEDKLSILIGAYDNGATNIEMEVKELSDIIFDIMDKEKLYNKKIIGLNYDDEDIEHEFYSALIDKKKLKELVIYTNRKVDNYLVGQVKNVLDEYNYTIKFYDIEHIYESYLNYVELDEDFVVNIAELNRKIRALRVPNFNNQQNVQVYLFAIDAFTLGNLYRRHETRLLTDNVRLYLKTSKINGGIIKSLSDEASNFVSYNNGISGVATNIDFDENDCISSITEFQIVNGGQTTASVHEALTRGKIDNPSEVFIPVKLTVISKEEKNKNLQIKIAKYANSQNKVNESDFASTQEFFIKFKEFCIYNVFDAKNDGKQIFFNIMRGQKEIYMHKEGMKPKDFKLEYPLVLDPAEISKIEMLWHGKAVEAAKGKESLLSNFIKTNLDISKPKYNCTNKEYKQVVSKILIRNYIDEISKQAPSAYSLLDPDKNITASTKPFGTIHSKILLYVTTLVFKALQKNEQFGYLLELIYDNNNYLSLMKKESLIRLIDDTFIYLTKKYHDVNEATKKPATFKDYEDKYKDKFTINVEINVRSK